MRIQICSFGEVKADYTGNFQKDVKATSSRYPVSGRLPENGLVQYII